MRSGVIPGALPQLVVERGQALVGGVEGGRVRVADARHDVPVAAGPAGQLQRPARRNHVQAPLRVEHVGEAEQVVLVRAAAVMQHQQPRRVAGRGSLTERQVTHALHHGVMTTAWNVDQHGDIAIVRLAGEKTGNPFDADSLRAGSRLADELSAQEPGAIVVTGDDRFFSAGLDLKMLPGLDRDGQREIVAGLNSLYAGWYGVARPVVAAISGHAAAGGMILALCADYRVASTRVKLGLSEVRVGVAMPIVVDAVCRSELPPHAARVLMLGGELVDAAEALRLGAIDELTEPGATLDRALEVAAARARLPRKAYADLKAQQRGELSARMRAWVRDDADPALDGWFGPESLATTRTEFGPVVCTRNAAANAPKVSPWFAREVTLIAQFSLTIVSVVDPGLLSEDALNVTS